MSGKLRSLLWRPQEQETYAWISRLIQNVVNHWFTTKQSLMMAFQIRWWRLLLWVISFTASRRWCHTKCERTPKRKVWWERYLKSQDGPCMNLEIDAWTFYRLLGRKTQRLSCSLECINLEIHVWRGEREHLIWNSWFECYLLLGLRRTLVRTTSEDEPLGQLSLSGASLSWLPLLSRRFRFWFHSKRHFFLDFLMTVRWRPTRFSAAGSESVFNSCEKIRNDKQRL